MTDVINIGKHHITRGWYIQHLNRMLDNIIENTTGCRFDMHEPDEQGLSARVIGGSFDNACVVTLGQVQASPDEKFNSFETGKTYSDMAIVLEKSEGDDTKPIGVYNVADLFALIRLLVIEIDGLKNDNRNVVKKIKRRKSQTPRNT